MSFSIIENELDAIYRPFNQYLHFDQVSNDQFRISQKCKTVELQYSLNSVLTH